MMRKDGNHNLKADEVERVELQIARLWNRKFGQTCIGKRAIWTWKNFQTLLDMLHVMQSQEWAKIIIRININYAHVYDGELLSE